MHIITAYERREKLSSDDLVRLKSALLGEVDRYRVSIRGYSAEKMQRHGTPFLSKLQARVEEVDRLLTLRGADQE
jgi:hypothetical protein